MPDVTVIGGGLAGSEAAWQAARRGASVVLYEMRPHKRGPAHHTGTLAELVCSNSLRGAALENAVGLLKEELARLDSLIVTSARDAAVPAGGALAVDRERFGALVESRLAVLSRDPQVLLDGFLGAVPYLVIAALCASISVYGAVAGLLLGQLHVWWRHTTELGWRTPAWGVRLARALQIVLPEDHDGHHRNPEIEFGDIFRFYDAPSRALIVFFRALDPKRKAAALRRAAMMKRRKMVKQTS